MQVIATEPAAGETGVSTRSRIRLTFDQPMAATAGSLLSFSPPVTGTEQWEGHSLIFTPAHPLQADTVYTVTLAAALQSTPGRALAAVPAWQFRTRSPRLLYVAPDEAGYDQLFVLNPAGGPPGQLPRAAVGLFDYRLSSDAARRGLRRQSGRWRQRFVAGLAHRRRGSITARLRRGDLHRGGVGQIRAAAGVRAPPHFAQ